MLDNNWKWIDTLLYDFTAPQPFYGYWLDGKFYTLINNHGVLSFEFDESVDDERGLPEGVSPPN